MTVDTVRTWWVTHSPVVSAGLAVLARLRSHDAHLRAQAARARRGTCVGVVLCHGPPEEGPAGEAGDAAVVDVIGGLGSINRN